MDALLYAVASGQAMRVPLVEGQSALGIRVEIVEGFVAVRKSNEPRKRKAA